MIVFIILTIMIICLAIGYKLLYNHYYTGYKKQMATWKKQRRQYD